MVKKTPGADAPGVFFAYGTALAVFKVEKGLTPGGQFVIKMIRSWVFLPDSRLFRRCQRITWL